MEWWHELLLSALASESIRKLDEFDLMECGNSAWAFARFSMRDDKIFSPLFQRIFESPAKVDSQAVHALCCATWALGRGDLTWQLLEGRVREGQAIDATSHGFLLMHGSWPGDQRREVQVLTLLAWVASAEVLRPVAARWVSCHRWFDRAFHPNRTLMVSENDIGGWYRY